MARAHMLRPVTDEQGNLLINAAVAVQEYEVSTPIGQPLYADAESATELPNPFTLANGVVDFWLDKPQRVNLLIQVPGRADRLVTLDAQPPAPEVVRSEQALRIIGPAEIGQVLTASPTPGEATWEDPPGADGLVPLATVHANDFADGLDPAGWTFEVDPAWTRDYPGDVPSGTTYAKSLRLTQGTTTAAVYNVTSNSVVLPAYGQMSLWFKNRLAPGQFVTLRIWDVNAGATVKAYNYPPNPGTWQFLWLQLAPGTYRLEMDFTGSTDFLGASETAFYLAGVLWQTGGQVPLHFHDGAGVASTVLGTAAVATGLQATSVGDSSEATGPGATALGYDSSASGDHAVALGPEAVAQSPKAVAVGYQAGGSGSSGFWTAVGYAAQADADEAVALGAQAAVNSQGGIAVGHQAQVGASAVEAVALGAGAQALADAGLALGAGATVQAGHARAVALGAGVASTAADQIMLGDSRHIVVATGLLRGLGDARVGGASSRLGFFGQAGATRQVVSGGFGGNTTVQQALQALHNLGLISWDQAAPGGQASVGLLDGFSRSDPGTGALGIPDYAQQLTWAHVALAGSNAVPSGGPAWAINNTTHKASKGVADGLGALLNWNTQGQRVRFKAAIGVGATGVKIWVALRHAGTAGAAHLVVLLDQATDQVSIGSASAANPPVITPIGAAQALTVDPWDAAEHTIDVEIADLVIIVRIDTEVHVFGGIVAPPAGTYVGLDTNNTTVTFDNIEAVPA